MKKSSYCFLLELEHRVALGTNLNRMLQDLLTDSIATSADGPENSRDCLCLVWWPSRSVLCCVAVALGDNFRPAEPSPASTSSPSSTPPLHRTAPARRAGSGSGLHTTEGYYINIILVSSLCPDLKEGIRFSLHSLSMHKDGNISVISYLI